MSNDLHGMPYERACLARNRYPRRHDTATWYEKSQSRIKSIMERIRKQDEGFMFWKLM